MRSNKKRFSWKLLIIVVILGIVGALFGPSLICPIKDAVRDANVTQLRAIEPALDQHYLDTSQYPDTLEGLIKNTENYPKWDGPYLKRPEILKDPWGNNYQYKNPGREGRAYDLYSFGADGREGGEGDNADINGWEVKGK